MECEDDEFKMYFTVLVEKDKWVNRVQAKRRMQQIIREGLNKSMAQFEGQLVAVIPIGSGVEGMRYKIIFKAVPDHLLQYVILPTMKEHGHVKLRSREEVDVDRVHHAASRNLRQSNRKALGDAGRQQDLTEQLMRLRGEGGTATAKRKFAESCVGILDRSGRIATTRLSEFCEDAHGVDDES